MSLKNAVVLVAGGTGIVGSGIVYALVQNGAKCWVTSRMDQRLNELMKIIPSQFHSQIATYKVDMNNENEGLKLREEILSKEGKLNHVVSSIGGGWRTDGKLSDLNVDTFKNVLMNYTLPHLICYKTFAKHLALNSPNSSYLFVTGGSCEAKLFDPKASLLPVTTGAHYGLFTAANSEFNRNKNLAIMELRIFTWVRKELDAKFEQKKSEIELGSDFVGKFVPKLILNHKSDIYKIPTRSGANQLFAKIQNKI